MLARSTKRLDREGGFTLIELLVASTMMVIITGVSVSLFVSALQGQKRVTSSADKIGDARVALRLMSEDIRQGSAVLTGSTAAILKLTTYIHASSCTAAPDAAAAARACEVVWTCAKEGSAGTYQCTRKVSTAAAVKVVTGLSNASIFTYTPTTVTAATYVNAKLTFPTVSSTVTFENGAALRNSATVLGY